mmetsp:Transcript_11836/g.22913  ORF Transcript_11836/g.22913 Transcript_11836/m.22913 type:complete len:425 (-) Transcript_11836:74-1348(-)
MSSHRAFAALATRVPPIVVAATVPLTNRSGGVDGGGKQLMCPRARHVLPHGVLICHEEHGHSHSHGHTHSHGHGHSHGHSNSHDDGQPHNSEGRKVALGSLPIAVVGDIFVDVVAKVQRLPVWDADTDAASVDVLPGGSGLNQARHLHGLGMTVSFFGALGVDSFAEMLKMHVEGQGFHLKHVKLFPNLPTSVCVVLAGPSDRAFVSCCSANNALNTEDLEDRSEALAGCSHMHIGGYFNLKGIQDPRFVSLVRRCRALGMTISLNTQYDAGEAWTGTDGHLGNLLTLVDVLFVNGTEAERVAASICPSHVDRLGAEGALCYTFPELTLVVTRGKEGAEVRRHDMSTVQVPTVPVDEVVDATGAGDAFLAGFLSVWLRRSPEGDRTVASVSLLEAACARGHSAARVCVSRHGACVEPLKMDDLE